MAIKIIMIEEHREVLSLEECHWLIDETKRFMSGESVDIREIGKILEEKTRPHAQKYMSRSGGTIGSDGIFFNGFTFRYAEPGYNDNLHYDPEVICNDGKISLRAFTCLIYLNTMVDDGYLILPKQKKVIVPEAGKLVIFPASYLFPHYVPAISADRYFLRPQWNLRTDMDSRFECLNGANGGS